MTDNSNNINCNLYDFLSPCDKHNAKHYDFYDCDYANDFECVLDVHNYHPDIPELKFDIWLKAYDTSCCETQGERELYGKGYLYECYVCVQSEDGYIIKGMTPRAAKDREDAERTLINMANNLMSDKSLIKTLKDSIDGNITVMDF